MCNLQSAKKLRLGRNLTGNSTCPSTRDGEPEWQEVDLYSLEVTHGPFVLVWFSSQRCGVGVKLSYGLTLLDAVGDVDGVLAVV